MKIFLSWSGEGSQSHRLAQAFKEWLPSVFQSVKPFLSSKDIYAGVQWFPKLKAELETADFGIVCLTRSNLTAPYIMLESGAIGMKVGGIKLVPVLCDMSITDLEDNPLRAFNCVHLSRDGILKLAESINTNLGEKGLLDAMLSKTFNIWWPEFELKAAEIIATPDKDAPAKKEFDVEAAVEQIHANINALAREQTSERIRMLELTKSVVDYMRASFGDTGLLPRAPLGFGPLTNALFASASAPPAPSGSWVIHSSPEDDPSKKEPKDE